MPGNLQHLQIVHLLFMAFGCTSNYNVDGNVQLQLLNWQKRASSEKGPSMYRIAPQSAAVPKYLVPKTVQAPTMAALDPRGAFVVALKQQTIIWQA